MLYHVIVDVHLIQNIHIRSIGHTMRFDKKYISVIDTFKCIPTSILLKRDRMFSSIDNMPRGMIGIVNAKQ